ncbi:Sulfite reductase [Roseovarius sp. EC-HK134]|mgnify:FL=1|jgi:hypothetical protein|uniref:Sulfite reductase n=1 Tax=Roseovarius mucosus TaxID=215743 RepID=A0A1V0RJF0_9RHOB|nr:MULTISPECIES: DUF2849 domain-containing protein [Roseovarius]MBS4010584.1 DUF2849 domain-containing protein [Roseovarius sp.]ARE81903.1 sulfite reductase [Roseovarius mucosus]AWZ21940.1 Hypothetical protein RAK1035_3233 [Roseovarius sp. AK1035]EDM32134.1 hypothetical protein RTM1035_09374 [Roseovarius sp. TM1035]MBW4972225.1 DUF2849 domain-containing protein [Roseovarius mucosus]|tara:strand:+ start:1399 stop:1710 length:312 start_codon:yes stop_codon:yes gene_type:complete
MAQEFTPKVVTANALIEGDVVYLTAADTWARDLAQAEVLTDEADADYRLLQAQARAGEIVGAYLADVKHGPNGPEPTHFREDFRRKGPSNLFHGKQSEGLSRA